MENMSFRESVTPYFWAMVAAVGSYFFAGWILLKYGMSAPVLPGIFAAITLNCFNKKAGWIQAIVLTLFVLICSLKFQSDYLQQSTLFVGFQVSIGEGFKVLWNKLLAQEIFLHLFGAAFTFFEASPFHFSRIRAKIQQVPVVREEPSFKRTLLPYLFGICGTALGGILFFIAVQQWGLYAPMLPGLFASLALSCVLKRSDPLRPIFFSVVVLACSLYIQLTYISKPAPFSFVEGVLNITKYLSPFYLILHGIGPVFTFIEAKRVSPQFS
ncbi:MAG: hypothetical protein AABZ60_13480 [Planctomycetota bacterium]